SWYFVTRDDVPAGWSITPGADKRPPSAHLQGNTTAVEEKISPFLLTVMRYQKDVANKDRFVIPRVIRGWVLRGVPLSEDLYLYEKAGPVTYLKLGKEKYSSHC
ncbi:hypothetical protein ACFL35_06520, partial [Candidatus Riflebacteria bacterium]